MSVSLGILLWRQAGSLGAASDLEQTIALTIDRTELHLPPDRVQFEFDLSGAGFDSTSTYDAITDTTYSNGFAPEQHNILFYVFTGETGSYSRPSRLLPEMNTRTALLGHKTQHVYGATGTYQARGIAYEPSSGKWGMTPVYDIVVDDPDVFYAGDRTVYINPNGDSDFTDAIAGSTQVELAAGNELRKSDPFWTAQYGQHRRYLLKRGATYDCQVQWQGVPLSFMMGTYGAGAAPILTTPPNWRTFDVFNLRPSVMTDVRIESFTAVGGHDPATTDATAGVTNFWGGGNDHNLDLTIYDCDISNFGGYTFYWGGELTDDFRLAIHDCSIDNFGGQYGVLVGSFGVGSDGLNMFSYVGNRSHASLEGKASDGNMRANLRFADVGCAYGASNDLLGVSGTGQPLIKMFDKGEASYAQQAVFHSNIGEGNWGLAAYNMNTTDAAGQIGNIVIEKNIYIANHRSRFGFRTTGQGVTIRGNAAWVPDIAVSDQWRGFVWASRDGDAPYLNTDVAPIRSHNNNWMMDRDTANGGLDETLNTGPDTPGNSAFTDASEVDNVLHAPNLDTPIDGSVSTADSGISTLYTGRVDDSYVLDTSYATPGVVYLGEPNVGAAQIGGKSSQLPLPSGLTESLDGFDSWPFDRAGPFPNAGAI